MSGRRLHLSRGVSLVEALVALVVMSFGVLGVVGMQATLRSNADISRQRSEAVRIAQEAIETWRGYTSIPLVSGQTAYANINTTPSANVTGYTTNTAYTLTRTTDVAPAGRAKTVLVTVSWTDRTGQAQAVRLSTNIAGIPPELAGSLGLPTDSTAVRRPLARHAAIPLSATPQDGGTSAFSPPGAPDVTWTFDNTTGFITRICVPECTDVSAFLLSGYVAFAQGSAPTAASAENPSATRFTLDVVVNRTAPSAATVACYEQGINTYVLGYWCAVPVASTPPQRWSGSSVLSFSGIAATLAGAASTDFKVCRYTPGRSEDANSDGIADGIKPLRGNVDHPFAYADVAGSLTNQNFLVISAGDGTTPYDCPADGSGSPLNTSTWRHQPAS